MANIPIVYYMALGHVCFEFSCFPKQKYTADDRFPGNGPYGENSDRERII